MENIILGDLVNTLGSFGAIIFIVIYLLKRDSTLQEETRKREAESMKESLEREDRLSNRLNAIEDRQHMLVVDSLSKTNQIIADNTAALREFASAVKTRPCLVKE